MNIQLPEDVSSEVQLLLAEGRFQDESEVVTEGVRLLLIKERLRKDVQAGIADLDAGNSIDAKEAYAAARQRIKAIEDRQIELKNG